MTKKNAAKAATTTTKTTSTPATAVAAGVLLTPEVIARLQSADSLDSAVEMLAPASSRVSADATYTLNATCAEPLPQKRGVCVKVIAVAARLNRPFKVADIVAAIPDLKSAGYWTRKLSKTGHLTVVTTE